jgi:hypothetical protein
MFLLLTNTITDIVLRIGQFSLAQALNVLGVRMRNNVLDGRLKPRVRRYKIKIKDTSLRTRSSGTISFSPTLIQFQ